MEDWDGVLVKGNELGMPAVRGKGGEVKLRLKGG